VLSIVLEIPKNKLVRGGQSSIVHVWATTSTPNGNHINKQAVFKQIELLSRPAVKELFEVFNQHRLTNVVSPYDDRFIQGAIAHFMAHVAGRSSSISSVVSAVLYPNEMAADLSQNGPAAYLGVETGGATGSKFGGRGLTDNVIDTSLGVVFGNTIPALGLAQDDGKENDCLTSQHVTSGQGGQQTQATYPYLAPPHYHRATRTAKAANSPTGLPLSARRKGICRMSCGVLSKEHSPAPRAATGRRRQREWLADGSQSSALSPSRCARADRPSPIRSATSRSTTSANYPARAATSRCAMCSTWPRFRPLH
jgi:hypothetical protein